ncbi:TonB-dependent receptor domain-containing protein [Halpernia sp.]|uniref:TonB-dependent receptor domain-containing protein n=1 Tax=Halpernia sp. TaxID=2782209 RepID=UPI003A914D97
MTSQFEFTSIIRKKTLALTFILGAASLAFSQQKVSVTGNVVDKQKQIVPYTSITFANKTNKLFSDAVLTDEKGNYKIDLVPGDYNVTIEAIDFKKFTLSKTISSAGNIGSFTITRESSATNTQTQDIKAVELVANKKPVQVQIDKKVYDVKSDLTAIGGNLQDVLQNVPSVDVDTDGTVSMRGNSNVKFLINGKPSALLGIDDGANALQSIPADQIDRIEVMTNPSSKYDASGTAGILNIILKKNKKMGFNGSVVGSLGYLPKTNLNTNLSWRKGNLTYFINGGGGYNESKSKNNNDTNYINSAVGQILTSNQNSNSKNTSQNYNANAGFVYDFNDNTSINASGTVRTYNNNSDGTVNYSDLYNLASGSTAINPLVSQRLSDGNSKNLAFQGDFGLDHKFDDKGQNISLSLSLQRNRSNNTNKVNETQNNIFSLANIIDNKSINKSIVAKADYELPMGEKSTFNAGYKLDANINDYDNAVQEKTVTNPNYQFLNDYTSSTVYQERINAVYAQFKSKMGDFGYQLGIRDEYSNITIDYKNVAGAGSKNTKNYNGIFPSVFLSYDLSKNNQFLLNYSRRIDRPRSWFLIPYPSYNDNRNLFYGNPDLNPSYIDSYEFGYNLSKSKFTLNPTLYYRNEKDDVKFIVAQDPQNPSNFITTPANLGTDQRYGLDLNGSFDAFSWLKFMGSFNIYGYKTTGIYTYTDGLGAQRFIDYSGSGVSTRSRLSTTFKIDKTFNVQLQGFYRGGQKTASQTSKSMYALNLGATKTIWKGDGTLAFNIQDIFNTRARETSQIASNYIRDSYMQWSPRQVSLSLTYRFKQGEKIEMPKNKKDINANDTGGDEQQGPM